MPIAAPPARLLNISTRARVQTDDNVLIGGFIITGATPKKVIVRAIGPSLGPTLLGPSALADPTLELFQQGNPVAIASNDNWRENQAEVEATGLAPTDDAESALVRTLDPGAYTVIVRGKTGAPASAWWKLSTSATPAPAWLILARAVLWKPPTT